MFDRAVDVNKGCYLGQEIVARMYSRKVVARKIVGFQMKIDAQPIAGAPTKRAFSAFVKAFERGALIRTTGDIIALSPPLIITKGQINELIDHVREVLRMVD